jgi:hypothetical protein
MFYIVLAFTILSLFFVLVQYDSARVFKNKYAKVRTAMVSGSKMHIMAWSLVSPIIWWSSKWKEYDRLILGWTSYIYHFAL